MLADEQKFARTQLLGESVVTSGTCSGFETDLIDARDNDADGGEFNLQGLRLTLALIPPQCRVGVQSMIDVNRAHTVAVRLSREASEGVQQHRGIQTAAESDTNGGLRRQQCPAPVPALHSILKLTWREHEPRHRQPTL